MRQLSSRRRISVLVVATCLILSALAVTVTSAADSAATTQTTTSAAATTFSLERAPSWDDFIASPIGGLESPIVDIVQADGRRYRGQVNADGRPHGFGVRGNAQGEPVEGGEWRRGLLHGSGFRYMDGERYVGEFDDGQYHGVGTLIDKAGDRYSGRWSRGIVNGVCAVTLANGGVFEGEFVLGTTEGMAMEWDAEGKIIQTGRWHEGVFKERSTVPRSIIREGKFLTPEAREAEFINFDGTPARYEGERDERQRPHGRGTMFDAQGKAIQGDLWKHGRQHGKGYLHMKNTYEGEFEHGRFHGHGLYVLAIGTTYEGEWKRDEMDGLGKLILSSGDILEGQWIRSEQQGFGIRWSKTGEMLRCGLYRGGRLNETRPVPLNVLPFGTFLTEPAKKADLIYPFGTTGRYYIGDVEPTAFVAHGTGRMYDMAGTAVAGEHWVHGRQAGQGFMEVDAGTYTGEIFDGDAHGRGKLTNAKGLVLYDGEWRRGQMHGQGVQTLPHGPVYTGTFMEGQRHGLGQEMRSDGLYEGEWQFGLHHGFGVLWSKVDRFVRVGRFKHGKFIHEAVIPRKVLPIADVLAPEAKLAEFLWLDGSPVRYTGARHSQTHLPHGRGEMIAAKGDVLVEKGTFQAGLLHGDGAFIMFSDGSKYTGRMSEGLMDGHGVLTWRDGDRYEGEFKEDARAGKGVLTYANGNSYEGEWEEDRMSGRGVITWADGAVFEGQFVSNEKEGFGVVWDKDGVRQTTGLFGAGKLLRVTYVPTVVLPQKKFLTEHERASDLIFPTGHYIGALDARLNPHGRGVLYDANNAPVQSGNWRHGLFVGEEEVDLNEPAPTIVGQDTSTVGAAATPSAGASSTGAADGAAGNGEHQHGHEEL